MEHVRDLDVSRILDYVCLLAKPCLPPKNGNAVETVESAILEHRFPQQDHDDCAFPAEVLDLFCFPSSDPCALTPAPFPFFSTFILTDASGHRTYVSSLRWLARQDDGSDEDGSDHDDGDGSDGSDGSDGRDGRDGSDNDDNNVSVSSSREPSKVALCYKCLCLIGRIPLYSLHEALLILTFALLSYDAMVHAQVQSVPVPCPERILHRLIRTTPVPGNKEVLSLDFGSHLLYYGLGMTSSNSNNSIPRGQLFNPPNAFLPHIDDAMVRDVLIFLFLFFWNGWDTIFSRNFLLSFSFLFFVSLQTAPRLISHDVTSLYHHHY